MGKDDRIERFPARADRSNTLRPTHTDGFSQGCGETATNVAKAQRAISESKPSSKPDGSQRS